jgi:regulator of protease activity HflC (stomatin/prohibitin superfamily)
MTGMFGFKIIRQYERGVVFRWGRALPGIREPGLIWVNPFTDRLRKVNMQITVVAVPGQETITRDNVTMRVDAVVYYRVVDRSRRSSTCRTTASPWRRSPRPRCGLSPGAAT